MTAIGKNGVVGAAGAAEAEGPAPAEQSWDDRFKSAVNAFDAWWRGREAAKASKALLDRQKLAAVHRAIHRAELTKKFLEGEFWADFLLPELSGEQQAKPWRPGDTRTLEQFAMENLVASGKAEFAKAVLESFKTWVRAGDDARKVLADDAARRGRVQEMLRG